MCALCKVSVLLHEIKVHDRLGRCPESLVVHCQATLFWVVGSNLPGSVSSPLSDGNAFVSLLHAWGVAINACV